MRVRKILGQKRGNGTVFIIAEGRGYEWNSKCVCLCDWALTLSDVCEGGGVGGGSTGESRTEWWVQNWKSSHIPHPLLCSICSTHSVTLLMTDRHLHQLQTTNICLLINPALLEKKNKLNSSNNKGRHLSFLQIGNENWKLWVGVNVFKNNASY